jgi:AAA family ATP:ADP antiporter
MERVFQVRRGEADRALLLFAYLFLIIFSNVVSKSARDAIFLARFTPVQMLYADIPVAILVGPVVALYLRLSRRTHLPRLLGGSLLFFAANCFAFWWFSHGTSQPWLIPALYVWVGIVGVLAPAQVWTLANYVLTTREAKRLYGVIGSGAISGMILGGFVTRLIAKRLGTNMLLLVTAIALAGCPLLVLAIWRRRQPGAGEVQTTPAAPAEPQKGGGGFLETLALMRSSRHLLAVAALICFASLVTQIAAWQFKAIAKQAIPEKDALAALFGTFNFYAGFASLAAQLLFTSQILRKLGLGPALFIAPSALAAGSVGVLVSSTLPAAIILRGSDQVLRYSIDRSAVELLYLPVPPSEIFRAKSFIDTVVWRFGEGLGSVTALVFLNLMHMSPSGLSVIVLVLLGGWMAAAYEAKRQYVSNLSEGIARHRLDAERLSASVLDRSTADVLAASLGGNDPQEILYALNLFQIGHSGATHPAVRGLLAHSAPEVRTRALEILSAAGDRQAIPQIEKMLQDPDLGVRTEALSFLTHHAHIDPLERISQLGDFPGFALRASMVGFLARPGESQNLDVAALMLDTLVTEARESDARQRIELARLIGTLPDQFSGHLEALIADSDPDVVRSAIQSVGGVRNLALVPRVIERLRDPALAGEAAAALAQFGDEMVELLRARLVDPDEPAEIRREISSVLLLIGTPAAEEVLADNLLDRDAILRFRVLMALNKLRQQRPGGALDLELVEMVLAAEILGHYRSYQILGTLDGQFDGDSTVIQGLKQSMEHDLERIFRLMKLLLPHYDMHSAYFGLQSDNPKVHDNAVEFLENVLKPQMRDMLVPVLDRAVSADARVKIANRLLGKPMESREEAVSALMVSEDPWLQSCAAYAIGALGLTTLGPSLDRWLGHSDALLRETARRAKERLAAGSAQQDPLRARTSESG